MISLNFVSQVYFTQHMQFKSKFIITKIINHFDYKKILILKIPSYLFSHHEHKTKNNSTILRRKTTTLKYDPPYVKKPMAKYVTSANANHHSIDEEMSLDGSNKLMLNNPNQFVG